jgi:hypothetical protein
MWFLALIAVAFVAVALSQELGGYNVTLSAKDTTCVCTTVSCPEAGNNPLHEGGSTEITYRYTMHGSQPVVTSAEGTVYPDSLGHGTDTTSCTQAYSRMLDDDGVQDCDAGHILANHLGGLGNEPTNIFPQAASMNRGVYAQFEGKIYDCIASSGCTSGYLTWKFNYQDSTRTKPDSVFYTATFKGGDCDYIESTFDNTGN